MTEQLYSASDLRIGLACALRNGVKELKRRYRWLAANATEGARTPGGHRFERRTHIISETHLVVLSDLVAVLTERLGGTPEGCPLMDRLPGRSDTSPADG